MLWQGIHFLNVFSPAAISPATAAPTQDPTPTIPTQTPFILLPHRHFSFAPDALLKLLRPERGSLCGRGPCVWKGREPTPPKRDVKGPRTILLVAAAQTTLTALQRRNTRFPAKFHSRSGGGA